MYNEDNVWIDEQCKFIIRQDSEGNNIEVDAIRKESGVWYDNTFVEPTPEWIAENQPVIEPIPPEPTLEEKFNALASEFLTLLGV